MYSRQQGCLPMLTAFCGFALVAYYFLMLVYAIVLYWTRTASISFERLVESIVAVGTMALLLIVFFLTGLFFAGMFPDIKIVREGIKFRYLHFFKGLILWEEVEGVIEVIRPRGGMAFVISRKGPNFINGLYFNSLYGIMNRHDKPLLLISSGLEKRGEILREVRQRTSASQT
jgi:hypothetical protein